MTNSKWNKELRQLRFLRLSVVGFGVTVGISPFFVQWAYRVTRSYFWSADCPAVLDTSGMRLVSSLVALSLPALLTAASVGCLLKSSRPGAWRKLALLPLTFFGLLAGGVVLESETLGTLGTLCFLAAPNWLGEIYRVRAVRLHLNFSAVFLFLHHLLFFLFLFVMFTRSRASDEWFGIVWWAGYLVVLFFLWLDLSVELSHRRATGPGQDCLGEDSNLEAKL